MKKYSMLDIVLAIVSLILPLVGLIIYFVQRTGNYSRAQLCLNCAIVGILLYILKVYVL